MKEIHVSFAIAIVFVIALVISNYRAKTKEKRRIKREYQETLEDFKDI